jgi:hypothetical protein
MSATLFILFGDFGLTTILDIKPANVLMAVLDDVSSSLVSASLSDPLETLTGMVRDGHNILRIQSRATPYPLPSGDLNASDTWGNTHIKVADVGVGTSRYIFCNEDSEYPST